jgi:hypothetical protein
MFEIFKFIVGVCLLSDYNQIVYTLLHYNSNKSFDNILILFWIFKFNDALCLLCSYNVHSLQCSACTAVIILLLYLLLCCNNYINFDNNMRVLF